MNTLKKFIKRYPQQTFLILFNTGVFAWLQTTGLAIAAKLGFSSISSTVLLSHVPSWLRLLTGDSLEKLQTFFGSSALIWFTVSMILTIVIRFIKGVLKFIIFTVIIIIGILLVLQNHSILSNLNLF